MRIQIVLFDGFDPLDVLGPFEVFHIGAGLTGGRLTVELVSAEGPRPVPSGLEAVSLTATAALDPAADLVVVPGAVGALALDPEVDGGIGQLLARAGSSALAGPLREAVGREGTTVATVCGGSLLVAWAGLADGRPLVTHGHGADLAAPRRAPWTPASSTTATWSAPATSPAASTWRCTCSSGRSARRSPTPSSRSSATSGAARCGGPRGSR
jgi:putative intracellular protease/amidase